MLGNILLIDDSRDLTDTVYDYLQNTGFNIFVAENSTSALKALASQSFDVCLLDLDLPDNKGFGLMMSIHQQYNMMPIIIISGHDNEDEKVVGLELGAVDFITKPFSLRELQARIRVVLRHKVSTEFSQVEKTDQVNKADSSLEFCGLEFDLITRTISNHDEVLIELTENEAKTLYLLIKADGVPLSRDEILAKKSGGKSISNHRSVDITIARIRQKLSPFLSGSIIDTVHGKGYRLKRETRSIVGGMTA